jgi:hypothetical protein
MQARKRKTRMISFRLTQQEYDQLQAMCEHYRVRNVSALTRLALGQLDGNKIDGGEEVVSFEDRLWSVNRRIEALEEEVRHLAGNERAQAAVN